MSILMAMTCQTLAVKMHCAWVGSAGEVTVCWDKNGTAPGSFRSWYLYHSTTANGPYTAIDSVFLYTDSSRTHLLANAANTNAYYYVAFKSNNGSPDLLSDTIRAIGLNINNPGNGYANLSWNPTRTPLVSTNYPYYYIYREYPPGFFTLLDSVDARVSPVPMTYTDLISVCDDTIKYKIEVKDSSGCKSISPLKGDRFRDFQVPTIPVLDSVSVDLFGNATISWQVSTSPDTRSYIILQNPGPVAIDTVVGHFTTLYVSSVAANTSSQSFLIIAVDSCNNPSAPSDFHSTIFLSTSFDKCLQSVDLTWTPYGFWGGSPTYRVFVSINGGAEQLIGSTTQTSFTDTNLISGSNFCYRIQAVETAGNRTSTSNRACLTPSFPPPPLFSYLRKVTVTGPDEVRIEAYVDPAANVRGYQLLRSEVPLGPFSVVATQLLSGVSNISFVDQVATDKGPYYYAISTLDSCGRPVLSSQISHTILLEGQALPDYTNAMSWTDYATWPNGVDRFNIYRSTNGVLSPLPAFTFTAQTFSFTEAILNDFYSNGEFCYVVEAIEQQGNPNFFVDSSRSNEICLKQEPIIFIPNAFHPGGIFNENFYPSNAFVSVKEYSLDIYNRWGENIFHTNDPREGWSGTSNGTYAPEGVYVYRLRAKNPDGSDVERVGSLTLIR
jgi:gliding motility-associated-like protein